MALLRTASPLPGIMKRKPSQNPNDSSISGPGAIFKHQGRILLLLVLSWAAFILYITLVRRKDCHQEHALIWTLATA